MEDTTRKALAILRELTKRGLDPDYAEHLTMRLTDQELDAGTAEEIAGRLLAGSPEKFVSTPTSAQPEGDFWTRLRERIHEEREKRAGRSGGTSAAERLGMGRRQP